MPPLSFDGRTALITGASSGIGRSMALALARSGCRVGLVARRLSALEGVAAEVRTAGGVAAITAADVGDRAQIRRAVVDLAETLGPADLVIANAGVGVPTTLDPVNIEAVEETIRVNLMGVIYTIEATLPAMLAQGSGHIAAVSSLMAYKGMPAESAYCASKAGVNAYLEGLRIQCRRRGIAVTTICPGYVLTPMTDSNTFAMPMLLDADAAAARIVRALSRKAKVYDFPGPMAWLVKAARWAPDWLVDRLSRSFTEGPPRPGPGG